MEPLKIKINHLLILLLIIGFFFRFYNLNWDDNFHLHPDERFLTMVGNTMSLPENFSEYLDRKNSPLNPDNIGYRFFVYGSLPLILNKYLATLTNADNYNFFTLQGRFLSALFDFLTLILVYKTAKLLFLQKKNHITLFSLFFYAISVYPIQSAHFFTVDTFLNFFMFTSFYFILRFYIFNKYVLRSTFYVLISSVFFGLALACKISALYILPLNLGVILFGFWQEKSNFLKKIKKYFLYIACYFLFFYLTVRLASPYYFQSENFFDPRLAESFMTSIKTLKSFSDKDVWYPPAIQWINKPWWGLLSTTILVGLGPVNFILMLTGIIWLLKNLNLKVKNSKLQLKIKNEEIILFLIFFWVIGYFVYQSLQFVKSIRYTLYLYPFFAIFGGLGIRVISYWLLIIGRIFFKNKFFLHVLRSTFYVLLFTWPLLFFTIYFHKNTRVEASEWIYQNLPSNSVILGEHWDDPLPLPVVNNYGKNFQVDLLPIFDPDTSEKWNKIKELLSKADYYVLSSNRGWGSIPTVPERYPIMSQYYKSLLNNDCQEQIKITGVCYKKIKKFLPYYYKFIRYPDSWVEETFTVYDHQTVLIYERVR